MKVTVFLLGSVAVMAVLYFAPTIRTRRALISDIKSGIHRDDEMVGRPPAGSGIKTFSFPWSIIYTNCRCRKIIGLEQTVGPASLFPPSNSPNSACNSGLAHVGGVG